MPSWECSHRTCFECDRADLMIGGFTQKNRRLGDQHAQARVERSKLTTMPPRLTNRLVAPGDTIEQAFIEFNVDDDYRITPESLASTDGGTIPMCWRMDTAMVSVPTSLARARQTRLKSRPRRN